MKIMCFICRQNVDAVLVSGEIIYPHREDLHYLKFWQCPKCKNYVGTHKGTENPLGSIVPKKIKTLRQKIHKLIDPIWKDGLMTRHDLYKLISDKLGYEYHCADITSVREAELVESVVLNIKKTLEVNNNDNE